MPSSLFQYDLFRAAAPLAIGLLSILFVASLRKDRRGKIGTRIYALFVLCTIGYLCANYLEICSGSEAQARLWTKVLYLFIAFIPSIWLDFCLRFTREGRGLSPIGYAAAFAIPVATIVIVFVPAFSPLMWPRVEYFFEGPYLLSRREHGSWFMVYAVYTYGVFLLGAAILIRSFTLFRKFYSRQAVWLLVGIAVPLASSLAYVFRPFPGFVKDFTSLGYAVAALLFYVALFRFDLFSIAPVGRALVVERMTEGVLVFDEAWRLADANPAAMLMLGLGEESLGKTIAFSSREELAEALLLEGSRDISIGKGEAAKSYRVEHYSLPRGRLVVLTDQTELRALLSKVEALALRDELTGLPNRRSFLSESGREFARARRLGSSLAAAMIDFDDFKSINDQRGHAAGDAVLRAFGAIVSEEARGEDIVARLGGDEFAALARGEGGAEGLRSFCLRLRQRLAEADIRDEVGKPVAATISVGIACRRFSPDSAATLDELVAEADAALYEAKGGGRNAIVVSGETP
jgi:diguanylate cyclase (GGDEF)-like protein